MYSLARPFLFGLDPEHAHEIGLRAIEAAYRTGLNPLLGRRPKPFPTKAFGLTFPNPVGLAAGLDKNGAHIDALLALGFGYVEVGTVTPRPQAGNPKPRLFRVAPADGVINRMGFNNDGAETVLRQLASRAHLGGIVGVNVEANKDSTDRVADYVKLIETFAPVASYFTVNVSSPNTPQ